MNSYNDKEKYEKYLDIEYDKENVYDIENIILSKGYLKELSINDYKLKLISANDLIEYETKYIKQNSILNYYNRG